jgi:hypothetical protein
MLLVKRAKGLLHLLGLEERENLSLDKEGQLVVSYLRSRKQ